MYGARMTAGAGQSTDPDRLLGRGYRRAPLVGRGGELSTLRRAAEAVRASGKPRVVSVFGAPGIGKTRLVDEFLDELRSAAAGAPGIHRTGARTPDRSHGAFSRLLRSRFKLDEPMSREACMAQVRTQVALVLGDRKVGDVCFFLGQLLELPFDDSPLTRAIAADPLEAGRLRRAVLKSFIEADARRSPLYLVFDDLEHADVDSLELLRYLAETASAPLLLLCSAGPAFLPRESLWHELAAGRHDVIELGPLDAEQAGLLTNALLSPCAGGAPAKLVEAALRVGGGNPGLLEQMLLLFHDAGVLAEQTGSEDPVWRVDLEKLASLPLPVSADDAVSARIGALSALERRILEHAAAFGSVFWFGGLLALGRMDRRAPELWTAREADDERDVKAALSALVERDYLLELPDSTFADEAEYVFKHHLERDKLAERTSPGLSRKYHQIIADFLVQKERVRSEEEYSAMLGRHLERAGSPVRAGIAYLQAGDIARLRHALKQADAHYGRGLALLGDADARQRIEALHHHGEVLVVLGETDAALRAFREMLTLAYRLGLKGKGGAAHDRIGRLHRDLGQLGQARAHFDAALALFVTVADERGIAACHDDIGQLHWLRGEYDLALEQLELGLEMRKKLGDRRSLALSLNNIGLVWMDHGRPANAKEALEAALRIRRSIADPLGIVQSLNDLGRLAQDQNQHRRALELLREARDRALEIGEHNRIVLVLTNMGESHYKLGETAEAIRLLKLAEEVCDELGDSLHLAEAKRGLAKAYLLQGELQQAREAIKRAVDLFGRVRSKARLASALRTLGEVTAAGAWGEDHEPKAVDYFMRSIALCKEIGNELEVAKSYKVFSTYVTGSHHFRNNADIQREARKLEQMAQEIFERLRISPRG
jgi:tetratricopeptide (TPR) repeat protein